MDDLILICETCGKPVTGNTGSIYVRLAEVTAAQRATREWKEAHPSGTAVDITELLMLPKDVHWRVGHDACRADHDEGCYEIDAPQIRAWRHVARWTAHLMEKNWFGLSDWDDLLRELSGEIPAKRIRIAAQEAA